MDPGLVGAVLDGKFQIERALGSGASGDVYEAVNLGLGARVALKVLRPGAPETADLRRRRFLREARVAARAQSDHVVRVLDVVAPESGPTYLVMELLTGETLAERLLRVGHVPVADAVDFVLQAAEPLADLHDAGIVHRDVKPSNLFVCRDRGDRDRIKLIDFGVAAFLDAGDPVRRPGDLPADGALTSTHALLGTPRFMAPEQARGDREIDARADVWALGVTLYVLLCGTPPFDGETTLALLGQIEHEEPAPLAGKVPNLPPGLARVVHQCLSKDPAGRPPNARALRAALAPFAPSTTPPRGSKRRVAFLAVGAAVGGLLLTAALAPKRPAGDVAAASAQAAPPPPPALAIAAASSQGSPSAAPPEAPAPAAPGSVRALTRDPVRPAPAGAPRRASLPAARPARALQEDDRIE